MNLLQFQINLCISAVYFIDMYSYNRKPYLTLRKEGVTHPVDPFNKSKNLTINQISEFASESVNTNPEKKPFLNIKNKFKFVASHNVSPINRSVGTSQQRVKTISEQIQDRIKRQCDLKNIKPEVPQSELVSCQKKLQVAIQQNEQLKATIHQLKIEIETHKRSLLEKEYTNLTQINSLRAQFDAMQQEQRNNNKHNLKQLKHQYDEQLLQYKFVIERQKIEYRQLEQAYQKIEDNQQQTQFYKAKIIALQFENDSLNKQMATFRDVGQTLPVQGNVNIILRDQIMQIQKLKKQCSDKQQLIYHLTSQVECLNVELKNIKSKTELDQQILSTSIVNTTHRFQTQFEQLKHETQIKQMKIKALQELLGRSIK